MAENTGMRFILRRANEKDSEFLFNLRNDPEVYRTAFNDRPVELSGHKKWLQKKLESRNSAIYIAEIDFVSIGQIRFDVDEAGKAEVDVAIEKSFRGRGYGSTIIREGSKKFFQDFLGINQIQSFIKPENQSSIRSFANAGYGLQGEIDYDGRLCILMILTR